MNWSENVVSYEIRMVLSSCHSFLWVAFDNRSRCFIAMQLYQDLFHFSMRQITDHLMEEHYLC